jgi:hypothetical protein
MSGGGIFAASMLLAALLMVFVDIPFTGQVVVPLVERSGLSAAAGLEGSEALSLAFGKIIVYLILTMAIYLFLRSVHKSFSHGEHEGRKALSKYS